MEWPVKNSQLPMSPNFGQSDDGMHSVPEPSLEVVAGDRVVYDEGKEVVVSPNNYAYAESTIIPPTSPSEMTSSATATTPGQHKSSPVQFALQPVKPAPFDGHYDGMQHHDHRGMHHGHNGHGHSYSISHGHGHGHGHGNHRGMDDDGKIVVTTNANDKQPWYRKPIVLAGLIILAVVIILAAVLGGIFGSRAANNNNSSDSDSSSGSGSGSTGTITGGLATATATSTGSSSAPTSIAAGSPIGVSAWKNGNDQNIYVVYQDGSNGLQYSKATSSGAQTEFKWRDPRSLKPESTLGKNAGLAMSVSVDQSNDANSQIQLGMLYVNESSYINGLNYVTGGTAEAQGFTTSAINKEPFKVMKNSTLASYWPFVLYQNTSGTVHALWYESETPYVPYQLPAQAAQGSNLAVVPVSRNVTKISGSGYWAIFYQDEQGKINNSPDPAFWSEKRADDLVDIIKTWNSTFPSITLPIGASFSAFSLARGDNDKVNTFLLYQDGSDIKQAWINNDNGWQISSPQALQGADEGTHIACVTPPVWKKDRSLSERLLQEQSDLTKCYFQKNRKLFEARLEGKDWVDLKEIALP